MEYTKKIIYQSNYWYNDGLKKAQMKDISGAIASLRRSLSYNGNNIDARNLLGLVYYGRGEVSEALVEWILSKNLMHENNMANYYIKNIQNTPGELERINRAVKRYNQSLIYCRRNGDDVAIIQLKKAISEHPSFLKAYQLLALIYIKNGQYRVARPLLKKARKMDTTNAITLSYIHEVSEAAEKKPKKEEKVNLDETTRIDISDMVSKRTEKKVKNTSSGKYGIKHLIISGIVGALVVAFLAVPAIISSKTLDDNDKILEYSKRVNAMKAQISAQSRALEEYRQKSIDDDGSAKNAVVVKEAYENLLYARAQYEDGNYSKEAVSEILKNINPDLLGTSGVELYDSFQANAYKSASASLFESGEMAYENGEYKKAVELFKRVVDLGQTYKDGEALLNLGNAYYKLEDYMEAEKCFEHLIKILPDSPNSEYAKKALDKIKEIKEQ